MLAKRDATRRLRRNFGKIEHVVGIPNLIEMQKASYERFLQKDAAPDARQEIGLQGAFMSVFPIQDFAGTASLEFVKYSFEDTKYDEEDCLNKGLNYEAPMRLTVRLVVFDTEGGKENRSIRYIKEQEIYFGSIPIMTDRGTFIINGTERVIVSQLHRSPGVSFDHDKGKSHASGKLLYSARIIPLRGSWLDFEFDPRDILYVRIDRRRKFPVTTLLKALGFRTEEILSDFYKIEKIGIDEAGLWREASIENLYQWKLPKDIADPVTDKLVARKGDKYTKKLHRDLQSANISRIPIDIEDVEGRIVPSDIVDSNTGEVLVECNHLVSKEIIEKLKASGVTEIPCIVMGGEGVSGTIRETMLLDKIDEPDEAVLDIYRKMRPSSPPTPEVAKLFLNNMFFNINTYDLSKVGRLKLNYRLGLDVPLDMRTLRREDIVATLKELIQLKTAEALVDDIDNLGNRRVRGVGELLENQYRIGLVRMERAIKERMSLQEVETLMPHDLINSKPVSAVVKEFFGTSQLSQFMDQTNPLSEVTHKRRLSALGPGGLTRERAGFEVRDVHPTHYGRICPIETPEGPNIGLIVSLSTYARVNEFGFIETPYRKVAEGRALKEIEYLSALEEKDFPIAQANVALGANGRIIHDEAAVRIRGEASKSAVEDVRFMDVSPNQLVSVSASLIPFLEHDDANRALMGSNMQRQAVPLLKAKAPLVGTGIEAVVVRDSGTSVVARKDGIVEDVDGSRIVIRSNGGKDGEDSEVEIYKLIKFKRSNQNSCYNQQPIVKIGDAIKKGQIIADGPASELGELALGQNVMVAFMSWGGFNFEDSILISERVVLEDIYTSLHIEEFEIVSRDTKLGKEEITRDIPNVGEEALKNLDESGIVKIGAEVKHGDILVGKITPKGETQLSPEEKLLRAIFGDKAGDVKDTSLRVPPGVEGIVIDAKVFSRRGVEKDQRSLAIELTERKRLEKDLKDELEVIGRSVREKLKDFLLGLKLKTDLVERGTGNFLLKAGKAIKIEDLQRIDLQAWSGADFKAPMDIIEKAEKLLDNYSKKVNRIESLFEQKIERLGQGDELPPGVIKMVKVYIAVKRKLSVGDKMAGRHGNKGVLSRILPIEDMPYFSDGTPVDLILNPLGVPSRMNVGQVLETHLGWASRELGRQLGELVDKVAGSDAIREKLKSILSPKEFTNYVDKASDDDVLETVKLLGNGLPVATPVFDGIKEKDIRALLKEAGLPESGQATLYDGRTGEKFDQQITVGVMYMLKLHHLVDDKLHARSIGPYSLVTQQPLGGKAQFGGQRLGEMEVWAMEAYGAAYSLQEFLTVKSDDVAGRTRMYERIVKGNNVLEAGLPESFKVLIKELQSLTLDVQLFEENQIEES
ncbi:MAG: DNA-directed RNA polymerase subunit beta [Deltaproteobacteria bacterium CG_4_8_14_3_um_filter_51_11]|nr:DNA-directed RNA polymerase subunit beta [bacterium]NCP07954.1 DNA-directed RNA polymerase subunit beta [bacterium]OIP40770.1 MAG: DNA-directed RNA polymerase subunit beta [Desulfobacteraceae bacterium CG2_30_51_40]PIP48722.1 MAG: DNA-directed RNA polymerase subunit beta [Deltaproteobacteria bacterium CG23_combo_of_CG06-09_8_20_14_all_51_20]PIX19201.1 MAG: DNA-directed RNA polymerase subunit beta [Deltaproteobacteria bacterium CG_4_8_14_3_um_filter_51_11]